jgi:hypothetical protein
LSKESTIEEKRGEKRAMTRKIKFERENYVYIRLMST